MPTPARTASASARVGSLGTPLPFLTRGQVPVPMFPSTEVSRYRDMRGGRLRICPPTLYDLGVEICNAGRCRDGWRSTVPG